MQPFERLAQGCSGLHGYDLFSSPAEQPVTHEETGGRRDFLVNKQQTADSEQQTANTNSKQQSANGVCCLLFTVPLSAVCCSLFAIRRIVAALALCVLAFVACSTPKPSSQTSNVRSVTDEAGRTVNVPAEIERVVSLAPNLTEIVYAVGGGEQLVGNTTYCDYPEAARQVAKIGDTLQPSIERILSLRPQLVLVSTASQLEAFTRQMDDHGIVVYVTNPRDLEGVFQSLENVGQLLNREEQAKQLVHQLRERAAAITTAVQARTPVRVFYQLSAEPLYTAGRDSYVTDLIQRAGGVSVTAGVPEAWPRFSQESAVAARPDAIVLPTGGSMGSANSQVAAGLKNSPAVLNGKVYKINGDLLSRPGPRLVEGLAELARALHPEAFAK